MKLSIETVLDTINLANPVVLVLAELELDSEQEMSSGRAVPYLLKGKVPQTAQV